MSPSIPTRTLPTPARRLDPRRLDPRRLDPRRLDPRRLDRGGFSLIELLIVVAIIAALVGVAVPMFQDNIHDANVAKCRQDLDAIRQAITLHDSQNRPLIGTSLAPLLGRYLQEQPIDPWGNEYYLDANIGVILSFGADQLRGGLTEQDQDIPQKYKPALKINRVQYTGSWGQVKDGEALKIYFSKPFEGDATTDYSGAVGEFALIQDTRASYGLVFNTDGLQQLTAPDQNTEDLPAVPTGSDITYGTAWEGAWSVDNSTTDDNTEATDGKQGLLVLRFTQSGEPTEARVRITSSMGINLTGTSTVIVERPAKDGPFDTAAFPSAPAPDFAEPIEGVGDENRGVLIERVR